MRNALTLAAFADWLDTQPPRKKYNYLDNERCLICQYFDFLGMRYWFVSYREWFDRDGNRHPLPEGFNAVSSAEDAEGNIGPWTFGAAAKRARARAA
jgi:hypothetical protein